MVSTKVRIQEFEIKEADELDKLSIYRGRRFQWRRQGIALTAVKPYLLDFLAHYIKLEQKYDHARDVYMRIDILPDFAGNELNIIEVNTLFPDGWGVALRLSRAAGFPMRISQNDFPKRWFLPERYADYKGEFNLSIAELSRATGQEFAEQVKEGWNNDAVFCFGRWTRNDLPFLLEDTTRIAPWQVSELEDKLRLAKLWNAHWWFSRESGYETSVRVPRSYLAATDAWESIPLDRVIFKFRDKHSPEAVRTRKSVLYPKDVGKGRYVRKMYEANKVIAQEILFCNEINGELCQIQILARNYSVLGGYCLFAPLGTKIINDSYVHAPLVIES
jgi:hypothetical protein